MTDPYCVELLLTLHDALSDVVGRRADDGQRRAQLVGYGRDEVELQPRQPLRATAGGDQHPHADHEQQQRAEAHRQIALLHVGHERAQRSTPPVPDDELPVVLCRGVAKTRKPGKGRQSAPVPDCPRSCETPSAVMATPRSMAARRR